MEAGDILGSLIRGSGSFFRELGVQIDLGSFSRKQDLVF